MCCKMCATFKFNANVEASAYCTLENLMKRLLFNISSHHHLTWKIIEIVQFAGINAYSSTFENVMPFTRLFLSPHNFTKDCYDDLSIFNHGKVRIYVKKYIPDKLIDESILHKNV